MENITPDYVDFEISKLLKEKDMIPHSDNKSDWKNEPNHKFAFKENGEIYKTLMPRISNYEDYLAPEISLVVKWLYLKHNIWIVVNVNIQGSWYFELYNLKEKRNSQIDIKEFEEETYTTPEQAYLEAIKYTLTKLI
jgi:hypothetical protein